MDVSNYLNINQGTELEYSFKELISNLRMQTLPDSRTLPSVTDTRQRPKNTRQIVGRVQHSAKRTRPFFYRRSRLCQVPFLGHSANVCRVPRRTRQKRMKQDGRTGRMGRDGEGNFAECRTRGTRQRSKVRRVPDLQHSANFETLPSARRVALGEVWIFAECHAFGTRRSFKLRRVPR